MSSLKDKREQLNIRQHTSFSGSLLFKGRSKHIDEPKNLKQIIKKNRTKLVTEKFYQIFLLLPVVISSIYYFHNDI